MGYVDKVSIDFVLELFIIKSYGIRKSLVKLSGLVKAITKMVKWCLGMIKVTIFVA